MRIASRMPRKSRITQRGPYEDIGLFWVEVQKRGGTMMDNGTVQPTKWYSNSKKLVILFSQPPVLWVAECWNKVEAKVPFTSIFTNWCYKFALKEEKEHFPTPVDDQITAVVDPEEVDMLISSPNLAQGNLMIIVKESSHDPIMWKSLIPISCHSKKSLPSSTRWRRRMGTNHTFMQRVCFFSSLPTSQTIWSYSSRHNYWTDLWGSYCEKSCKPGDVTFVVTCRETERFVNEIHTHEAKTRNLVQTLSVFFQFTSDSRAFWR